MRGMNQTDSLEAQVAEEFCAYLDAADDRVDLSMMLVLEVKRKSDRDRKRKSREEARVVRRHTEERICGGCGDPIDVLVGGSRAGRVRRHHNHACREKAYRIRKAAAP